MSIKSGILSIGTAVPKNKLDQKEVCNTILHAMPEEDSRSYQLVRRIYKTGGIEFRHTVIENFLQTQTHQPFIPNTPITYCGPSTEERNNLFIQHSGSLACLAVNDALRKVPTFATTTITHLITVSCTGFSAPGFDFDIIEQFKLNLTIARLHIGFMGCYAAIPAMRTANSICQADPHAVVLIVCVELCSLHYRHQFDTDTILANSLFADGAAAVLVSSSTAHKKVALLESFYATICQTTKNEMGWIIGNHGFTMNLSQQVPKLVGSILPDIIKHHEKILSRAENPFRFFAIHPGGRAILDHAEKALLLINDELSYSRNILNDYGNMSSSTVLFVLDKIIQSKMQGLAFTAAFGPGLCAETAAISIL